MHSSVTSTSANKRTGKGKSLLPSSATAARPTATAAVKTPKTHVGAGKTGVLPVSSSSSTTSPKKKKAATSPGQYTTYIFKVLRDVHPKTTISKRAMSIMNSFVMDTFERIATEAGKLCSYTKKDTLTAREISTATRLVLPGELARHAVNDGMKAVSTFTGPTPSKH